MTVEYSVESYAAVIDELRPLLSQHWREIALHQDDIPLDPDYSLYEAADRAVRMLVATARQDDALVGYAVYFIRPHPHYQTRTWAVSDIFWLHPAHRRGRTGDGLFAFTEQALTTRGVDVMHTTSKTAHPAAARLLESRGHAMIEVGHSKRLG